MKKVNVICKGITVNERVTVREEVQFKPKPLRCPKCKGDSIMSVVTVYATASVCVNSFEVDEVIDAEFDDPTEVEEVSCYDCEYEWEVTAVIENGMYVYKAVN